MEQPYRAALFDGRGFSFFWQVYDLCLANLQGDELVFRYPFFIPGGSQFFQRFQDWFIGEDKSPPVNPEGP